MRYSDNQNERRHLQEDDAVWKDGEQGSLTVFDNKWKLLRSFCDSLQYGCAFPQKPLGQLQAFVAVPGYGVPLVLPCFRQKD